MSLKTEVKSTLTNLLQKVNSLLDEDRIWDATDLVRSFSSLAYDTEYLEVLKDFDEEKREVTGVVLTPEKPDLHNDYISKEEVAKACDNFNKNCMVANINHEVNVSKDFVEFTKSFITPIDCKIGDKDVPEGSWVMVAKVHDDDVWSICKDRGINGFSIGGYGLFEDME